MIAFHAPTPWEPAQHAAFGETVRGLLAEADFVNGGPVRRLEEVLIAATGASACVAVGSGTEALALTLLAAGLERGDEVITSAFTFWATVSAVLRSGASPVPVDIETGSYGIDPQRIEEAITERTKAIVPVHLFSQLADMDGVLDVAARHNLLVIEDSAEAYGMSWRGTHAGALGDAGVLSFFPTKTAPAFGDAGLVLSCNEELSRKVRMLRDHGRDEADPGVQVLAGTNGGMDSIQAAVVLTNLMTMDAQIKRRCDIAMRYTAALRHLAGQLETPVQVRDSRIAGGVWYVYLIETVARDELQRFLADRQIQTEIYYPRPVHAQPGFRGAVGFATATPVADRVCERALALPLYPGLSDGDVDVVCDAIISFFEARVS